MCLLEQNDAFNYKTDQFFIRWKGHFFAGHVTLMPLVPKPQTSIQIIVMVIYHLGATYINQWNLLPFSHST